jgi:hypothetical protein
MVGHEPPAGGRELVGGSPLANATFRVFPDKSNLRNRGLYERRNLADLRPVLPPGQHLNPFRLDSSQSRQEAGQFQLPHVGQFPVPSTGIVLKSTRGPRR